MAEIKGAWKPEEDVALRKCVQQSCTGDGIDWGGCARSLRSSDVCWVAQLHCEQRTHGQPCGFQTKPLPATLPSVRNR